MAIQRFENVSNKMLWVDVTNPDKDELRELSKEYDLNTYALSDCLQPDHLPKHEDMFGTHFIITRVQTKILPQQHASIQSLSTKIAFFYRQGLLVTIHRLPHSFIQDIKEKFFDHDTCQMVESIVAKMLWYILHSYEDLAVKLSNEMDEFESKVFSQNITPQMLSDLYQIKRKALISKKLLLFSQEAISSVKLPDNQSDIIQDARDLHQKLLHIYDQIHEDVSNLVSFYLSISAQKTNDVIKVLTIFSVFFMPLTFLVGIYGMNFEYMPELHQWWAYPALLCMMCVISGLIYIWFRRKKWL